MSINLFEPIRYRLLAVPTLPASPAVGQMNFDQSTGTMAFWNGTAWSSIGPPQFQNVPYNAGDFYGLGTLAWTVPPASVATFRFLDFLSPTKMMLVSFIVGNTTVGGAPDYYLAVKIPNGRVPVGVTWATGTAWQGAPGPGPGGMPGFLMVTVVNAPLTYLILAKTDGTRWNLDAGFTQICFNLWFEYA